MTDKETKPGKLPHGGQIGNQNADGYDPKYDDMAYSIYATKKFATKAHVAHACGVCKKTIDNWRHKHPSFASALARGRTANEVLLWNMAEAEMFNKDFNFKVFSLHMVTKSATVPDYPEDGQPAEANKYTLEELERIKMMTDKYDRERT